MVDYEKRTIALAGLIQAIHLVSTAANTGMVSQDSLEQSLRSIFVQSPGSIAEVYGGTRGIRPGLNLLKEIINGQNLNEYVDLFRYSMSVIALERRLRRLPDIMDRLGRGIETIERKQNEVIDEDTIADLARLYEETLSGVEPRIRINGRRNHLENRENIHRIRALLLAAVRAAVLWRQVGGRRWQFLLARQKMKSALKNVY